MANKTPGIHPNVQRITVIKTIKKLLLRTAAGGKATHSSNLGNLISNPTANDNKINKLSIAITVQRLL